MHDFLNSIARAYAADPQVRSYTFVFPNVRSRAYFQQTLANIMGVAPESIKTMFLTLAQLVEQGCGMKIAPKERLLFILYKAYCNIRRRLGMEAEPFDRFRFWGGMILSDFNDVDRYLADPVQLFRNVGDYKEIQAFYLTPEQEELIRTYWRADPYWQSAFEHRDRMTELPFWNHISRKGEPAKKFTQLWAILGDLYTEFRKLLADTNECYPGMAYRAVAETLLCGDRLPFNPRLYVFIGFNRLSHSEHAIFRELQRSGSAHFYWDYDPALMNHREANTAGRFISTYIKNFNSCNPEVKIPLRPATHSVEIIAVPGATAQAQIASAILHGNETALVLADAEMLVPTVSAIPEEYERINVTMGYPLRFSALVQLISQLTKMQMRVSYDAKGRAIFFHDDVAELVKHPAVQGAFPEAAAALVPFMRTNRLFNLTPDDLTEEFECLRPLLGSISKDAGAHEVAAYLGSLLDYSGEHNMIEGIDRVAYQKIRDLIADLASWSDEYGVEADRRTLLDMIERSLIETTVPMEGESFEAVQVMGVLETRALGYNNVVMLSMTDANFPGTDGSRSFIPESLRRAYGLPTRDHAEADSAYHFYRILSWARSLTLIYDARCGAMRTGQPSRYLTQLVHGDFPGVLVSNRVVGFAPPALSGDAESDGSLSKTFLLDRLNTYLDPGQIELSALSASALKTYLNCPKEFFLEKILKLSPSDPFERETSAADHGNVVHQTAERIYNYFLETQGGNVTRADLDSLLDGGFDGLLERELTRAVNINMLFVPEFLDIDKKEENPKIYTPITSGEEIFYIDGLRRELHSLFRRESTPLTIIATEKNFRFPLEVAPGQTLNFNMYIDRIDRIEENGKTVVRIIDYKSGNDQTSFSSVDSLFEVGRHDIPKAIFQLLVYCEAYHQITGTPREYIRPMIFKIKQMEAPGFPLLEYAKKPLENYAQVADEFRERFAALITEIFNPDLRAPMADKEANCRYCKIKGKLCRY